MSRSIARGTTRRSILAITLFTLALFATIGAQGQSPLSVTITPGTDANGEPTYKATVSLASGFPNATSLTVTYTLPPMELPISPSPSGGCLFTPGPVHLVAVCTSSTALVAGQPQDFLIAVHPTDTAPQDVNVAVTDSLGRTASAFTTSTITAVGLSEMQVDLSSTNPGKVGETFTYNVTVTNIQDDDARNVFAILVLPKGSRLITVPKGCTKTITVICKLGQMSPGTSKTVTITTVPTISGWAQATAGIRLTTPDRYFPNNSSANSIWINP